MTDGVSAPAEGSLVEVAVALPVAETFTYRDPRRDARAPLGAQVVVPFGGRHVTGFVVGYPQVAPARVRDIQEVIEDEPALDPHVLELCQWAAGYYVASLGEVLRLAVPQGERAAAARRVRASEKGRLLLKHEGAGQLSGAAAFIALSLDESDRALLGRLAAAPRGLGWKGLRDAETTARLKRLEELELVEVGDDVRGKVSPRAKRGAAGAVAPERADSAAGASAPTLNEHQSVAFEALKEALAAGTFAAFVLQGVTGSGKTEVYLRLIAEARAREKGALVIVPEIALTPQLEARFRARFGDDVAVLHSGLAPAERRAAWRRLRRGEVGIALGARSAIFAPVRNLAVAVVDEEHDSSFKQDDGVRYHGRDLALVRAQRAGALVVLGSATPSLETWNNIAVGRYRRLLLPTRANPAAAARPLPPVEIVDLRREPLLADGLFSKRLLTAVQETLAAGEQSILFLNRRGFAPVVLCRACGQVLRCSDCSVSFTYHRQGERLVCHYCARTRTLPHACPACGLPRLEPLGIGTERVEGVVRSHLPNARVARLDRDTAGGGRGQAVETLLAAVADRRIDILVGTQMVTKGHDFSGVTLVGVLMPDLGMHLPDFRAAERTFQLLEQVAGRAGRADRPGRVIVQTYSPEHPALQCLRTHDYEGFARGEVERRREAGYPPAVRLLALRFEGPDARTVRTAAEEVAARLRTERDEGLRVLGPAEAPIPFLRGRARWQVWVAAREVRAISAAARRAVAAPIPHDVRLAVDVDPQSVL